MEIGEMCSDSPCRNDQVVPWERPGYVTSHATASGASRSRGTRYSPDFMPSDHRTNQRQRRCQRRIPSAFYGRVCGDAHRLS